jgi:hypothetical protein
MFLVVVVLFPILPQLFAIFAFSDGLQIGLFASSGCYSHDVMVRSAKEMEI